MKLVYGTGLQILIDGKYKFHYFKTIYVLDNMKFTVIFNKELLKKPRSTHLL